MFESQTKVQEIGFESNIIENHDLPRGVNMFLPDGEINYLDNKIILKPYQSIIFED